MPNSRKSVGTKVYIGDILESVSSRDIEDELSHFGPLTESPWIARNPPGFAFVYFKRSRDADTAIRILDGNYFCGSKVRVELGMDHHRDKARPHDHRNTSSGSERKRPKERERHLHPSSPRRQSSSKNSRSKSKFDRFDDRFNNNDEDDFYDMKDNNRRPLSPSYRSRSPLTHRRRSRSPLRKPDRPAKIPSLMDIPVAPVAVAPLLPDTCIHPPTTKRSRAWKEGRRKQRNNSRRQREDRLPPLRQHKAKQGQFSEPSRKGSGYHLSQRPTVPPPQRRSFDRNSDNDRRSPISTLYLPQANQPRKSSSKRPTSQQRGFSSRSKSPVGAKHISSTKRVFRSLSPRSPPRDSKRKAPNVPPPLMSQIVGPLTDPIVPPAAPLMDNDFLARYGSPLRDRSPQSPLSQTSSPEYNSRKSGGSGSHRNMTTYRTSPQTFKRSRSPYMSPPRERSPLKSPDKYSSLDLEMAQLKSKVGGYVVRSVQQNQLSRPTLGRSMIKSAVHKRYKDKKSDIKSQHRRPTEYPRGRAQGRERDPKYSAYSDSQSYRREDRLTPPRSALGAVYTPAEHRSLSPLDNGRYMTYLPPPPLPPPLLPPPRPKRNKRRNRGVKSRMSMKERRDARKNVTSRSNFKNLEYSKPSFGRSIPPPLPLPLPLHSHPEAGERHANFKTRRYTPPLVSPLPPPRSRDRPRRIAKPGSARQVVAARIKQRAIGKSRSTALRNQPRSRIRERRR